MPTVETIRVIVPIPQRVTIEVGTVSGGGSAVWGAITGTLTDQTDLNTALGLKVPTSRLISTTAPISGGGNLSADRTLSMHVADATHDGYLSSVDWNTFNSGGVSGAALTKSDDTNVTLTLGGSPATALVNAASLTLGWTGTLAIARGGTGAATVAAHTFFANNTAGVAAPSFTSFLAGSDYEVPLTGSKSITRTTNDFALTNDSVTPGNSKYYGTDSGGTRGYFTLPTGVSGGNPTASVGLTAVNGSAGTFLRSDGAPPLDVTISPNWSGAHSFTAGSIAVTTQSTSDNSTKAASTAYVTTAISNAIAGVNPAVAVQAATTVAGDTSTFTYLNGVSGVGATLTGPTANVAVTIDGFTFTVVGQRLLVKNDTQSPSGAFNGVYFLSTLQAIAVKPVFTRSLDYNQPSDINNTGAIPVVNGTLNGTTSWVLTSTVTTVGTDPLTFTEFSLNPTTIVTTSRTLTIGGTAQDLSADRSWLSNVTNDTQTKASIVPNTAPPAGKILVGNAGGTAYAPVTLSGGTSFTSSLSSAGVLSISDFAGSSTRGLVPDPGPLAPATTRFLADTGSWLAAGSSSGLLVAPITVNDYGTSFTIADTGGLNQPTRSTLTTTERTTLAGTGRETVFDPSNNPYSKGAYNQPPLIIRSGEFLQQYSELQLFGNERATFTEDGRLIVFSTLGSSGASVGNPGSQLLGLTAINGSAGTALRSDGAPALDQSIAPTWTGLHVWAKSDALTTSVTNVLTVGHNSTGTPSANFGTGIQFNGEDSTTDDQFMGGLRTIWSDATHATPKSYFEFLTAPLAGGQSMSFSSAGGLSVGLSRSGMAFGVINAETGFKISNNASTTGAILIGNGTNFVTSAITWPTSASTLGKVVKSDGTNLVMSTETYATPGTSGNILRSDGINWTSVNFPPPITFNDYGSFTIPDTGGEQQPTRLTFTSTERGTFAGTGRNTLFDPENSLSNLDKSFLSPPQFTLRDGEYVTQTGRTALTGNKRATMTETGRLVGIDYPSSCSRLILSGSSQNNN